MIDLDGLAAAHAERSPFPYLVAEHLVSPANLEAVGRGFPDIRHGGLIPPERLKLGGAVEALIDDMKAPAFSALIGAKLGMALTGLPRMITVRGRCAARDGRPHTDSEDKVATCLLYLNGEDWDDAGGRLRLLRSGDVNDLIAEVAPTGGTLVAFRRTDRSWHGHAPFEGPRRYLMCNWLRSDAARSKNRLRHMLSAAAKGLERRRG